MKAAEAFSLNQVYTRINQKQSYIPVLSEIYPPFFQVQTSVLLPFFPANIEHQACSQDYSTGSGSSRLLVKQQPGTTSRSST